MYVCTNCHSYLKKEKDSYKCNKCKKSYRIWKEIPVFVDKIKNETGQWEKHWVTDKRGFFETIFSWFRKYFISNMVKYYTDTYFKKKGVFIEAGSGTSETSIKVGRYQRKYIAIDIIPEVLLRTGNYFDEKINADIFNLPFEDNSIDGIWNVGVMEHFTNDKIDAIFSEFRRVLKDDGTIILFWPTKYALHLVIMSIVEKIISIFKHHFQFYPDHITPLLSRKHAAAILRRNNFKPISISCKLRDLYLAMIVVGRK